MRCESAPIYQYLCYVSMNILNILHIQCGVSALKGLKHYIIEFKFSLYWSWCLATANHNFKWVKITQICLIRDKTPANRDV